MNHINFYKKQDAIKTVVRKVFKIETSQNVGDELLKEEINRFTDNTINNRTYLTIFETRETYATLLKELNEERDELIKCIDQLQKMNYDEPFFDYKQLYKDLKFAKVDFVYNGYYGFCSLLYDLSRKCSENVSKEEYLEYKQEIENCCTILKAIQNTNECDADQVHNMIVEFNNYGKCYCNRINELNSVFDCDIILENDK